MNFIKYLTGSLIISFGIVLVAVVLLRSLQIDAPKDITTYLAIAWGVLAAAIYPFSKRIIRV